MNYDRLKDAIASAPETWLPSLLCVTIQACRKAKCFRESGGLLEFLTAHMVDETDKPLEFLDEVELGNLMTGIARTIQFQLPDRQDGQRSAFALLVFDDPKVAQYISSCHRDDVIVAMRACADRIERKEDVRR